MNAAALQRQGYSVAALRALAEKRLPRVLFDMVDGGAGDEITMRRNEAALAAIELSPKLLEGAATRDQSVELFGAKLRSPVMIGPTGLAGLLWPHAELAAVRAAARFGTVYCTSHASTATLEEIGAATPGPKWMQVFLYKDRGLTAEFAARAAAAGYKALILTVDNQVVAGRDRDARNGMTFPLRWGPRSVLDFLSRPGWLMRMAQTPQPTFVNYGKRTSIMAFGALMNEQLDPDVGWSDIDHLRRQWRGPLLIKGLLHPDDAREAIGRGRRRNHRLQPRRTPARLRGRNEPGATGRGRSGQRASAGPDRRRLSPRRRHRQGAGARSARGFDRPPAPLGRRLRRRGRGVLGA